MQNKINSTSGYSMYSCLRGPWNISNVYRSMSQVSPIHCNIICLIQNSDVILQLDDFVGKVLSVFDPETLVVMEMSTGRKVLFEMDRPQIQEVEKKLKGRSVLLRSNACRALTVPIVPIVVILLLWKKFHKSLYLSIP